MSEHFFSGLRFDELHAGMVLVDQQGARHTITEITGWEEHDDWWDEEKGDTYSAPGRTIYTDTYPKNGVVSGQTYSKDEVKNAKFTIVRERTPFWER